MSSVPQRTTIAFRLGGACIATCHWTTAQYEMPIIPTLPLHHGWPRDPLDNLIAVAALVVAVDVGSDAFGVAGAADIHVDDGVAAPHEVREALMHCGGVALVIRRVFQDRGVVPVGVGHHQVRREAHAVAHRDLDMLDEPDAGFRFHQLACSLIAAMGLQ
jgi:hypothetical protein